jgi:hypothetical protein
LLPVPVENGVFDKGKLYDFVSLAHVSLSRRAKSNSIDDMTQEEVDKLF